MSIKTPLIALLLLLILSLVSCSNDIGNGENSFSESISFEASDVDSNDEESDTESLDTGDASNNDTGSASNGDSEVPGIGEASSGSGNSGQSDNDGNLDNDSASSSIDCPTPQAVECIVRLYPQCGYMGPEICLTEERYYTHSELESMGMAKGTARSARVADGYYAEFNFTGDRDDDWEMVMRGDDSCLFLGDNPGGFAYKNVDVKRRTVCRDRPRVFMAMHGSNRLAKPDFDDNWTYVRENLDGIWENNTDISFDEMAAIYRKVNTRTMILEQAGSNKRDLHPVERFSVMQQQNPDIELIREAVALYKNPASEWNADDIPKAKAEYVTNPDVPSWMKFQHVYGGFQPKQFLLPEDNPSEPTLDQTEASVVMDQIDGGFAECGSDRCRGHFKRALYNFIMQLREDSRPFIWFTGTFDEPDDWFKGMKQQYYMLESDDMLRPDDIVMLINYHGLFDSTPETTKDELDGAATATGILYWLLNQ